MFHQNASRRPRTKGFKVKHAFQLALLLAVGIWFLYQIKQSPNMNNDDDENSVDRLSKGNGIKHFGRKEKLGFNNGVKTDTDNGNFEDAGEREEDGGGGDDEFDRHFKEAFGTEHEDLEENAASHEEGEGEKQQEGEHSEMRNATQEFRDENGVPRVGMLNEIKTVDQEMSSDQKPISDPESPTDSSGTVMTESGEFSYSSHSNKQNDTEKQTNDKTIGKETVQIQEGNVEGSKTGSKD